MKRDPNLSKAVFRVVCLLSATAATLLAIPASASDNMPASKLPGLLKQGGYVIYMRHASTEKDYADQVTAKIGNCATQRTLSEKGWKEAELIGASISLLGIPVGAVYSSEYCRAWKTARIAFGDSTKRPGLNFEPAETYTEAQTARMRSAVLPMLSAPPADGTNTVIVGHDDPFEAATGIYPDPQGVAYVVKPMANGKIEVMGHILPIDWPQLIAAQN